MNDEITLRDFFAALAMQAEITWQYEAGEYSPSVIADAAYDLADAMMLARAA